MKKVFLFSILLLLGLVCSQLVGFLTPQAKVVFAIVVKNLSLVLLAFIMIHVGLEFAIDRTNLKQYGWDYFVAFTAASLPWIFCAFYFVYAFEHSSNFSKYHLWIDALLLSRFAAPTSAGLLFSMLKAAGLDMTWMFQKIRILVIFDDIDTIILLIPIKMMIIGFKWEAILLLFLIAWMLYFAWQKMHTITWPINWYWVLVYSVALTFLCEGVYYTTKHLMNMTSLQIEVLLPAFVLGCVLAYHKKTPLHDSPKEINEKKVQYYISAIFIFLVGLSMPLIDISVGTPSLLEPLQKTSFWKMKVGTLTLQAVLLHVLIITFLSNLGKMFPIFCYRKEATLKERLALALGLWPRGEVGAGVIILATGLLTAFGHTLIVIATLSLAFNLILTGPLIAVIKKLLSEPKINMR